MYREHLARAVALCITGASLAACVSAARAAPNYTGAPVPAIPGSLVIAGGGQLGPEVVRRFLELAGGPEALIVVIPTAGGDSAYHEDWPGLKLLREAGARHIVVRSTRIRDVAETDSFVAPIREAGGIWLPGGRGWRLVDAYLGTRTERELHAVLERGGVIGGSSAGASIQASFLVRGARETNAVVIGPGYEKGFGFLRNVAIDQHVGQRGRERDLQLVVREHPSLLGIGLDEGTAIVVHGTLAEVVGPGRMYVHNGGDPLGADSVFTVLRGGERFDLASRRRLTGGIASGQY
jgi:cyanophycinase